MVENYTHTHTQHRAIHFLPVGNIVLISHLLSPEDKKQMLNLLQKFESENTPPLLGVESDTPTLEERLAGLDIGKSTGWACVIYCLTRCTVHLLLVCLPCRP